MACFLDIRPDFEDYEAQGCIILFIDIFLTFTTSPWAWASIMTRALSR